MTKRIKITDPKDLREGMRVEVQSDRYNTTGIVFRRDYYPSDKALRLGLCGDWKVLVDEEGDFEFNEYEIHRLIDGIEDVVAGDILTYKSCDMWFYVACLGRQGDLVDLSENNSNLHNVNSLEWFTRAKIEDLKNYEIYMPIDTEEPEKTELTLEELKAIAAKEKGVDVDNITIKDE